MKVTKSIARQVRRGLYAAAIVPALMLPACGDKVPAPELAEQIAQAAESLRREQAARRLAETRQREAEARLGGALWVAVLGSGAGLVLGLAVGSSRGRREGTGRDPSPSRRLRLGAGGADE